MTFHRGLPFDGYAMLSRATFLVGKNIQDLTVVTPISVTGTIGVGFSMKRYFR